tara:strand:+ start:218 stop:367 length:150 start_codon:yes stop_codon:yes gene_type:complete
MKTNQELDDILEVLIELSSQHGTELINTTVTLGEERYSLEKIFNLYRPG